MENTSIKVNQKNTSGNAALHLAVAGDGESEAIIQMLLDHEADPSALNGNKRDVSF